MNGLKPLAEQVIVITGGSSGIGRATALAAAQRGAKIVIAARNDAALRDTERDIADTGAEALAVPTEVADFDQVQALGDAAIARFGRIDTWVNNAAVALYGPFTEVTTPEFRRVIDVNLMGVVHGSKAALARMREHGGSIVNVGSIVSDLPVPLQTAYSAAKAGVKGFTEALRMECEHDHLSVQVVLIKPSSIDTPFFQHARSKMDVEPKPVPPVYGPGLVAETILHAATHRARALSVGGGGAGMSVIARVAPGLAVKQMALGGYAVQRTDRPVDPDTGDTLFDAAADRGGTLGGWNGRDWSVYQWWRLQSVPRRAAMTIGGVAAALSMRRAI
jgi:NAD(P)-dependent dehydrogenase (short-subunit alcohol dehydrogenase family)